MIENWEQYKDLEYYPDRFCKCGCGGRIKVKPHHSWAGIPEYIQGHSSKNGARAGKNNPMWHRNHSRKSCEKIGKTRKANGVEAWNKDKLLIERETRICACGCGETFECKINSKQRYINGHGKRGNHGSKETKERNRIAAAKRWRNPEYVSKQMVARGVSPNKPERFLDELFQQLFPNQIKYIGDGQVIIGGKCPDFINVNGQKKIIEMFGDYWHGEKKTGRTKEEEEQQRTNHFAQYGYQTLIIWEHELGNLQRLEKKLEGFCNG